MSKETVKTFYEALKADSAMADAFKAVAEAKKPATPEAASEVVIQFAAEKGYSFTAEDLKAFETEAQEIAAGDLEKVNAAGERNGFNMCFFIGAGWGDATCSMCRVLGAGFGGFG